MADGFTVSHAVNDPNAEGGQVMGAPDADPMIGGVQYMTVNPNDPASTARMQQFGLTPINHPQYGWIVPAGEKYNQAFPSRDDEGWFAKALPRIGASLMTMGATNGFGLGADASGGTPAALSPGSTGSGTMWGPDGTLVPDPYPSGGLPASISNAKLMNGATIPGGGQIINAGADALNTTGNSVFDMSQWENGGFDPNNGNPTWVDPAGSANSSYPFANDIGKAENMFNVPAEGLTANGLAPASSPFADFMKQIGVTPGTAASAAFNLFTQGQKTDQLNALSDKAFNASAVNQPQRLPYQANLLNLVQNPSSFFQTNPLFNAQKDQATQAFNADYAKKGMGGGSINDYMKNIMNTGSSTYFDQGNLLSGLGGFTQGPGNATAGVQAGALGALSQQGATNVFGPIVKSVGDSPAANDIYSQAANLFKFSQPDSLSGTVGTLP